MLVGNIVPEVQERSDCAERVEQSSEHSWACSGHEAKVSMLRLSIGSGKLSSCMLSIVLGPKAVQGKGWGLLCGTFPGMFGLLFGAFGRFGTFGTFLDLRNNVPGQHSLQLQGTMVW